MTFHDLCYFPWLSRPGKWSSQIPWLSMTRGHPGKCKHSTNNLNSVLWTCWACAQTIAWYCQPQMQWLCTLFSVAVTHHRQEHSFPDFSLITFKFPDFSMFSRLVATLLLGFKQITTTSLGPFSTTTRISSYHKWSKHLYPHNFY